MLRLYSPGYISEYDTVLYKTKSLNGTKPNTNTNLTLTQILTLFSCFMLFQAPFFDFQLALTCIRKFQFLLLLLLTAFLCNCLCDKM